MPSHSVATYLPRAPHIQNENELLSILAQEYSCFPSIHSYSVAFNNPSLPEPTTNSRIRSHSTQILMPSMMSIPLSYSKWTGVQDGASLYNGSLQPTPRQYFYCWQDKLLSGQNSNGQSSQDIQWLHRSAHDQISPFPSVKCDKDPQEQVNEDVKAMVGISPEDRFPTRRDTLTAYFTEPINQKSDSPEFPPGYRPLSSDDYKTSSSMDTLYASRDIFQNYPLAFERTLRDAEVSEQYGALSPDTTYPLSPVIPSPNDNDDDSDGGLSSEPYAQLIYRALKSVPSHRMVLKEIYEWFEKNTDKAKNNSSKGWQNSIRHNLSMNGVSHRPSCDMANTE